MLIIRLSQILVLFNIRLKCDMNQSNRLKQYLYFCYVALWSIVFNIIYQLIVYNNTKIVQDLIRQITQNLEQQIQVEPIQGFKDSVSLYNQQLDKLIQINLCQNTKEIFNN
ncbi:unnamed protein product [Paramecium sonneborni]|uniref:Transmembrane protein n=1 Tax=Paramecium sonneborni TaxID=65129 RepID=A0A8S1MD03_9CILI|nr:unnamed protein product [Paramecium sonneborni]